MALQSNMLEYIKEEGKRRKKKRRPVEQQLLEEFGVKGLTPIQVEHMKNLIKGALKKVGK